MPVRLFRRKISKVVAVVLIGSLLIILNPVNIFTPIQGIFLGIAAPFQKISYLAFFKIREARDFVASVGSLKDDNGKLFDENQRLQAENALLRDMERENGIFREQLDLVPRNKYGLEAADITSFDPNGLGAWLIINKGSRHGIEKGMTVIVSGNILVGRVEKVFPTTAQIMLLSNPDSVVNGVVNTSGSRGIVRGEHGLGLIFDMILQSDILKDGDEVVTSGADGLMPRGILVGKIREIRATQDRLYQQATVELPLKHSDLHMVFVIKEF